jgi:hypothetical protein
MESAARWNLETRNIAKPVKAGLSQSQIVPLRYRQQGVPTMHHVRQERRTESLERRE